jgi:hypothetical protein
MAEPTQGPRLTELSSQFITTQIPNPTAPGQILLDRRYTGSWGGAISFKDVPVGAHTLALIAYDGPGNHTATPAIPFDIVAFVDRDPPKLAINLLGTPGDGTVVAGSQIEVQLQSSDDGIVQSLSLSVDGVPQALPDYSPGQTIAVTVPVLAPPLGTVGPRPISFTASATDGTGKVTQTTTVANLVADSPPTASIVDPPGGTTLVEDQLRPFTVQNQDDTGVTRATISLSTADVAASGTYSVLVTASQLAAGMGAPAASLNFGGPSSSTLTSAPGFFIATPVPRASVHRGPASITISPGPSGLGARGVVTYHYRVRAGHESDAEAVRFISANPSNKHSISLDAPGFTADLSWPNASIEVDEISSPLPAARRSRSRSSARATTRTAAWSSARRAAASRSWSSGWTWSRRPRRR